MSDVVLTRAQHRAVYEREGSMLVSACAGAGKTFVLVERLMAWLEDGYDIDRFLVITYTKAAAAELRQRIYEALSNQIRLRRDEPNLRRQLAKLSACDICTVHALCKRLLDAHPDERGLRPGARLLDETQRDMLLSRVLDDLLDDCYESMEDSFSALVEATADAQGDRLLVDLVLSVYEKTRGLPKPEQWLQQQADSYVEAGKTTIFSTAWGSYIRESVRETLSQAVSDLQRAYAEIQSAPEVDAAYGPAFRDYALWGEQMGKALESDWDTAHKVAQQFPNPKLKVARGWKDKEFLERCKAARDRFKKRSEHIVSLLDGTELSHGADFAAQTPVIRGLVRTVLQYSHMLENEKQRLNVFDYGDLEHRAAALLTHADGVSPSETALRMADRYTEIMVDEYQDISPIQERIVQSLSRNGCNLYWVGDARQSIYRFRLADPALFLEKYNSFPDDAPKNQPRRALLGENFRSRSEVLTAVNALFSDIMSPEAGEMSFTHREYLRAAGKFSDASSMHGCELWLLDTHTKTGAEDENEDYSAVQAEADFVAGRIESLLREEFPVNEKDVGVRSLQPGDIAVLMRAPSARTGIYSRALSDRGIPCRVDGVSDFFSSPEILTAISLLRVIDNPRNDIALLASLRCPTWNIDDEWIASLRISHKAGDLFDAMEDEAQRGEGSPARFIDTLSVWRKLAPDLTVSEMLTRVLRDTGLLTRYAAAPNGEKRVKNLFDLLSLAEDYDNAQAQGLSSFLVWVDGLRAKKGAVAAKTTAFESNAVAVMSIHRAKGLEFPVVILADTAKRFNELDTHSAILVHTKAGLGMRRRDSGRMIEYPTLSRRAVAECMTREMLAEEMRMLYVAMTRAKEKLIVTAAPRSLSRTLSKWKCEYGGQTLPPQLVLEGRSYLDWLMMHLNRCAVPTNPIWRVETVQASSSLYTSFPSNPPPDTPNSEDEAAPGRPPCPEIARVSDPDPALVDEISRRLTYVYPYGEATVLPSKLTATALTEKDRAERAFDRPRFMRSHAEGLTSAERGTALHLAMQYANFERCRTKEGARQEVERLLREGYLSAAQADCIDSGKITQFFDSPLGRRVEAASVLHREYTFSILLPAETLTGSGFGEKILLQGVVDCCFEEPDGLVILDFKTDFLTLGTEELRALDYRPQMDAYARALSDIMGMRVKECLLYFFSTGRAVSVVGGTS